MDLKEIKSLPTILDIVEQLSARENEQLLRNASQIPGPDFFDEGRYNFVSGSGNTNIVHLMPTSQTPYTFMRGQSRYYDVCLPTLYRANPTEEEIESNKALIDRFGQLLLTHPVFQEISLNVFIDLVALAQHYGFSTDYIDITNNKWVAAFFACTGYDYKTDTYYPVGEDYYEGYGVMYVTKDIPDSSFFDKQVVIGYQYFTRPTMQSSFGMKMERGENFNDSPYFEKLYFRHDLTASKIVYDMAYKQSRFIPVDEVSILAGKIRSGQKDVAFDPNTIRRDIEQWESYGREDLQRRILPIMHIAKLECDGPYDGNAR